MNDILWINNYYKIIKNDILNNQIIENIILSKNMILKTRDINKKMIFIGNGASNTIASHASLDFNNQLGIKCLCFNDPNIITAFSNDHGYEYAIERFIKFNAEQNDLLIAISSSGQSNNIINAVLEMKNKKGKVITFSGFKKNNKLKKNGDINFWINNKNYNIVESIHNLWLVSICEIIIKDEKKLIGKHGRKI